MLLIDNPLSWPLYPILPMRRAGNKNPTAKGNLGFILATARMKVIPIVYVGNICDFAGRRVADIVCDPNVVREEFSSLTALQECWRVD